MGLWYSTTHSLSCMVSVYKMAWQSRVIKFGYRIVVIKESVISAECLFRKKLEQLPTLFATCNESMQPSKFYNNCRYRWTMWLKGALSWKCT